MICDYLHKFERKNVGFFSTIWNASEVFLSIENIRQKKKHEVFFHFVLKIGYYLLSRQHITTFLDQSESEGL